jgi:hypothetical protein
MGIASFILGIGVGIIITFLLILGYIVTTFGWDFIPVLMNFMDGNVSYQDILSLGQYYGYI